MHKIRYFGANVNVKRLQNQRIGGSRSLCNDNQGDNCQQQEERDDGQDALNHVQYSYNGPRTGFHLFIVVLSAVSFFCLGGSYFLRYPLGYFWHRWGRHYIAWGVFRLGV